MILKNKKALILSSLAILLPIPVWALLRSRMPDPVNMSWFFWCGPLIMLAVHWLCILFTYLDPGNKDRNKKMTTLVLWIIPVVSTLSYFGMFALNLGLEFSPVACTMVPLGILMAVIGNYMPKTRMNGTIGIKIPWTYSSEENWNATHRFAGKLWVPGGLAMILLGFLPNGWAVSLMFADLLVITVVPMLYSWRYYKQEQAQGTDLKQATHSMDPKMKKFLIPFLVVFSLFIGAVLFLGDISFEFREDHLYVDSTMYTDHILYYDAIEAVEYRTEDVPGLRVGGYGSFRLLMGWFENEEFGTHIRYSYYKPDACVIVTAKGSTLVLSGKTAEETRSLYETLLSKITP